MAALYLDEDVQNDVAPLLSAHGHLVVHARGYARGAKDDEQLLIAARAGWTLVTYNQGDFTLLHSAWLRWSQEWGVRPRHQGILLGRNVWPADETARRVHVFFRQPVQVENRLYRWVEPFGWQEFAVSTV